MLILPDDFRPAPLPPVDADHSAWWFVFAGGDLLVRPIANGTELPAASRWPFAKWPPVRCLYLGMLGDWPCYAAEAADAVPPPGLRFESLRGLWTRLDEGLLGVAGHAMQLIEWDRTHQFCGRCGTPTERLGDQRVRRCSACGLEAYPRLSPVVMVRINRGRELLLARAPRFAPGVYSVLAGFVEPGETLEQALRREIAEEVGIQVRNLHYFASQSWPFPHSLMIAFTAEYAEGEVRVDGQELLDARWFAPEDLPGLPNPMSMAWRLIQDFIAQERDD